MGNSDGKLYSTAAGLFESHFGSAHTTGAYAPGRIEVLGNHTDYNEGLVLSAAIDMGTVFLVALTESNECRLLACDTGEEAVFDISALAPSQEYGWANYVKGVVAGLRERGEMSHGFKASITRSIPLGSGLSSSAALEVAAGLALSALYGIEVAKLDLAKIGQRAEHEYAGVKCGLLDQISSLFGQEGSLVLTDFRSLAVKSVPMDDAVCFLMCDTRTKHALVDGEYNQRREHCEAAAEHFASVLDHPVAALRDVSWSEWEQHSGAMDSLTAQRAAHPIGECERVVAGAELLKSGSLEAFGRLMYDSHESSRKYFENSCTELDFVVDASVGVPGVLGARLSGGGFGGSVVLLVHDRDAEVAGKAIGAAFRREFGRECDISVVEPSAGASLIDS
jgi:galactokinase